MKFVLKYIKPYTGRITLELFIKFVGTIMDLFLPYILAHIIDNVTPTKNVKALVLWGVIMLICSALALICNIIANRMASAVARDTTRCIRRDLFTRISYLSGSQLDHYTVPSLISRMTSDTHHVHRTIGMLQRMGVRAPILVLGGIIMTLALDPALCLVLCCMMPLMTVVVLMVSKKGLPLFDKLQRSVDELVRVVRENTTGVRVIKALSRVNAEKERFNEVNTRVMKDERRANITMALTRPSTSLILNIGLVLVVVVGAHRVNAGLSEAGSITAFLTYFTIILNAMISVSRIITMSSQMIASANRIEEVINTPFELDPIPAAEVKENAPAIEFENVTFSYNKKRNNLENISFTLEKGQTLGILGPTGSGKSSLASLLLRFYDIDSGAIRINGQDIRELSHAELRQKFGVVFQNDMVFNDTIEGNIKLWRDIDPEALEKAVNVAQANFIENAGGYEAQVAARGANLSGGQKQRLLIARALAGAPEILILDDSSSALDYKTDAAMRAGVAKNFAGTTTIIIAQRVSSVRSCDKILVLERGQALGLGTHEELLKTCELYREIHTLQMGEGEE
ncbi:MAG: ABC transporter ATP-binding protein [Clostridia bacterium]|nr:ABC transporter ATP-binding protein [Clostridia bacterium]